MRSTLLPAPTPRIARVHRTPHIAGDVKASRPVPSQPPAVTCASGSRARLPIPGPPTANRVTAPGIEAPGGGGASPCADSPRHRPGRSRSLVEALRQRVSRGGIAPQDTGPARRGRQRGALGSPVARGGGSPREGGHRRRHERAGRPHKGKQRPPGYRAQPRPAPPRPAPPRRTTSPLTPSPTQAAPLCRPLLRPHSPTAAALPAQPLSPLTTDPAAAVKPARPPSEPASATTRAAPRGGTRKGRAVRFTAEPPGSAPPPARGVSARQQP